MQRERCQLDKYRRDVVTLGVTFSKGVPRESLRRQTGEESDRQAGRQTGSQEMGVSSSGRSIKTGSAGTGT